MDYHVFYEGKCLTIEISEEVEAVLAKMPKEAASIRRILELLADSGSVRNEQRFRNEQDGIYAAKASQLRVYGWRSKRKPRFFVCCTTDIKKRSKADPSVLERAKRMKREYEERD